MPVSKLAFPYFKTLPLLRIFKKNVKSISFSRKAFENGLSDILFENFGSKGVITLNRPKVLNAFTYDMIKQIYPILKEWESNKSLVIIKGAGNKAFCAGGDVVNLTESGEGYLTKVLFRDEYQLNNLIGRYSIPYIALMDGITMGGGVGLSVHGQFRIVTERTLLAMPEAEIGLFPDVGTSYFLSRLKGNLGVFLALTGHRLKGRDVLGAGVATHACDAERIPELERTLLNLNSTYAEDITAVIQDFSKASTFGKDEEFSLKPFASQIQKCFEGGSVEEIVSKLEADGSDWAKKQIDRLNKMSPTSLKITFEALKRGEHSTLPECLSMEYRLAQRCCADHDFYEGVRALLKDRDNSPKWKPDSLDQVTHQVIQKYFSNLPPEDELTFET